MQIVLADAQGHVLARQSTTLTVQPAPDHAIPALTSDLRQADRLAVAAAAVPGRTVLLVAGAGHVDEAVGVPQHLPAGLRWHALRWPGEPAKKDYCAELREQITAPPRSASGASPSGGATSGPAKPVPR